jgi:opacity protein-like surface antigen
MKTKMRMVGLLSMAVLFGSVSLAAAGAYGEPEEPAELPAPPPPPVVPAPAPMPVVESGPDYARNGFYLIGAATYAIEDFDIDDELGEAAGPSDSGSSLFDDSWGFNVRGGYRFHPHVAAEVEYDWYDDFLDVDGASLEAWALTANLKLYALTGCIQPYALLGAGMASFDASVDGEGLADEEDFVARFGGGVDVYVTENIAITGDASYMMPTGDLEDLDFVALSLGAMWRF